MDDLGEFQKLLFGLVRRDEGGNTEEVYERMKEQNVSAVVALHLANILSFVDPNLTAMSMILLKHIYQNNELRSRVDSNTCELVCKQLPVLFRDERLTKHLLEIFVDACAIIVPFHLENGLMYDFLTMLMELIQSPDTVKAALARDCLAQLHGVAPQCVQMEQEFIANAIGTGLTSLEDPSLTFASLRLLFEFYVNPTVTPNFVSVFAEPVSVIYRSIPQELLPVPLNDLYRFCLNKYHFFQHVLGNLVETLVMFIGGDVTEQISIFAIETVICLAKNYDAQFTQFLQPVTAAIMAASCRVDEQSILEENFPFADDAIFHLSEIFSEKTMYPSVVVKMAKEMVSKPEWQCKRAALVAVHRLISSCGDSLETEFDDLCQIICSWMKDPNPILRMNAYSAFCRLCSLQPVLLGSISDSFLNVTMSTLKEENVPRVRLTELKALDEFCKNCPSTTLAPASEHLIGLLLELLKQSLEPQEQIAAIRCITSISTSTQCPFEQFYAVFMPLLKEIYSSRRPGNDDPTRIRVLQAIPVIFMAVPPAVYEGAALEFLNNILAIGFDELGDEEKLETLDVLDKMADLSPELFAQVLPFVTRILNSILSSDLTTENLPLTCNVSQITDRVWKQLPKENCIICYHRAELQFVIKSMETLENMVLKFPEAIAPMVVDLYASLIRFITFDAYPPLQRESIQLLKALIPVYRILGGEILQEYLTLLQQHLINALTLPFTTTVRRASIDAFTELISTVAELQIQIPDLLAPVIAAVNVIIVQSTMRRRYIMERQNQSGVNSTDMLAEDDFDYALALFARCCLKYFTNETFPSAGPWLSMSADLFRMLLLAELLTAKPDPQGFSRMTDLILESMNSESMNRIRFAFIIFARFASKFTPEIARTVIEAAIGTIARFEDDEDYCTHLAIDGALVAIAAAIQANFLTDMQILGDWLSQLPMVSDFEEANIAYEAVLKLILEKNPIIMGEGALTKLLRIAGTVVRQKCISDAVKNGFREFVRGLPLTAVQNSLLELSIQERLEIQRMI